MGKIVLHEKLGWVFQTQLNFSHNLNLQVLDQISEFIYNHKIVDKLAPAESIEDYKAAERILEGAIKPGLSLHESRQILAMLEMGWTETATRQLRDLIEQ